MRNDLHSVKAYQLASDTLVLMPVNTPLKHCKASLSVLFHRLPLDGMLGSAPLPLCRPVTPVQLYGFNGP